MTFYICETCGNIVEFVKESGAPVSCCGKPMKELEYGTSDGAYEKHVPVAKVSGSKVTVEVGSVEHPMTDAHYIEWIVIETAKGSQKVKLTPQDAPKAELVLADGDSYVAAYAYCNLHGLWKSEA